MGLTASRPAPPAAIADGQTRSITSIAQGGKQPLLIVGLGNPGKQYENTRHNVGFDAIDQLAREHGIEWQKKLEHKAVTARGTIHGTPVILCKPMTFMNVSGESVAPIAKYYKIDLAQIIVVYDDLDSDFGVVKMKMKGGHGGHNGMRSIIQRLGNQKDFPRVKIGIGRPPGQMQVAAYVLGKFRKDEMDVCTAAVNDAVQALESACQLGMDLALSGKRL